MRWFLFWFRSLNMANAQAYVESIFPLWSQIFMHFKSETPLLPQHWGTRVDRMIMAEISQNVWSLKFGLKSWRPIGQHVCSPGVLLGRFLWLAVVNVCGSV